MLRSTNLHACRICQSEKLKAFLRFEHYPLSDNFLRSADDPAEYLMPYQAHWCEDCKTVQNLTDFDWSEYYSAYHYSTSQSSFMQQFIERVVAQLFQHYPLPSKANVVEIGSGDGAQLQSFLSQGSSVFGFEPSSILSERAIQDGVQTTQSLFSTKTVHEIPEALRPVHAFLTFFTFDHIPDPLDCLKAMRSVIDPEKGVLVIEVHDLEEIIARTEACLFCHEHTVYLSLKTMDDLLKRAGFRLIESDLIPQEFRRGNSLLIAAVPDSSPVQPKEMPSSALLKELDSWAIYARFQEEVRAAHLRVREYITSRTNSGRKLAGYGVSARSISTLSIADVKFPELAYVLDKNPHLKGFFLPFSKVPIHHLEHLKVQPVDELLVFSYGYLEEIRRDLKDFTAQGGRLTSLLDLLKGTADLR